MTLDPLTLLVVAALVITTSSGMFVAEAWVRTGDLVDRLWTLAFAAAVTTALAYVVSTLAHDGWWAAAVGNGASVLCVWAMWSGIRAYQRRPSRVVVSFTAALARRRGRACARARRRNLGRRDAWRWVAPRPGRWRVASRSYAARCARGEPRSCSLSSCSSAACSTRCASRCSCLRARTRHGFQEYLGTSITTLVNILLVNGAAFAAMTMRARSARERAAQGRNFDPMTGARTTHSFEPRAVDQLRRSAESLGPVAMVELVPEGLEALEVAFGRDVAEQALVTCGEVAQMLLPPRALMGLDPVGAGSFQVLLPGWDESDAVEWATQVRKELIATPVEVPSSHLRIGASAGIATARDHGYQLGELCDAARAAARLAVAEGGKRVVVAGATDAREAAGAEPAESTAE